MSRVLVSLAVAWLMTPLAPVRSEPQPSIPLQVNGKFLGCHALALRTAPRAECMRGSRRPAQPLGRRTPARLVGRDPSGKDRVPGR
jgi:hypothetical protein